MNASAIYAAITMGALGIVSLLLASFSSRRRPGTLSPLAGLALGIILLGIALGQNRWIGYGSLAIALALSILEVVLTSRQIQDEIRHQEDR